MCNKIDVEQLVHSPVPRHQAVKLLLGWRSIVMCVSVCLPAREHISGTTCPISIELFVRITHGRGSLVLWRGCELVIYTSGFSGVIFAQSHVD